MLLSTHGHWIWHPFPKDLWRWTHEGLSRTLEQWGFDIIDTMWIMGSLAYSSQLRVFYLKRKMTDKGPILRAFFYAASFVYNAIMALQDKLEGQGGKDNAAMYFLVAKKRTPVSVLRDRQ